MPDSGWRTGESHSPVVHELWVLVVVGSNPTSPTNLPQYDCILSQYRFGPGSTPSICVYRW